MAIDLNVPADQSQAQRIDTVGSGNHDYRADPQCERVYYSDLAVDGLRPQVLHRRLRRRCLDASPATPIELLRTPFVGNLGFSNQVSILGEFQRFGHAGSVGVPKKAWLCSSARGLAQRALACRA